MNNSGKRYGRLCFELQVEKNQAEGNLSRIIARLVDESIPQVRWLLRYFKWCIRLEPYDKDSIMEKPK